MDILSRGFIPVIFEFFDEKSFEEAVQENYVNVDLALNLLRSLNFSGDNYHRLPIYPGLGDCNIEFNGYAKIIKYVSESMNEDDCVAFLNDVCDLTVDDFDTDIMQVIVNKVTDISNVPFIVLLHFEMETELIAKLEQSYDKDSVKHFFDIFIDILEEKGLENETIIDYLFDTYIPSVLDHIPYKLLWRAYLQSPIDFSHRFNDYLLNNHNFINYVTQDKYIWIMSNHKTFDLIEEYERRNGTTVEMSIVFSMKKIFDLWGGKPMPNHYRDRINSALIKYVDLKCNFYVELRTYAEDRPQFRNICSKLQMCDLPRQHQLDKCEIDFLLEFLEYSYNK